MNAASDNNHVGDDKPAIAIIGMACIFPGAANLDQYWQNIQQGVCAITDVPASRWEPVFYDPTSSAADRFYCRKGGFVDDYVDFDPLAYGIMPKAAASADPDQLLSLRVGVEALQDAGLWDKAFNRDKTGVIIGRGNYLSAGTLRLEQHVRLVQQTLQTLQDLIPGIEPSQLTAVKQQIQGQLNDYGPDTAVGLIPNLVASRLANRLDLKGPAYTVDGACASALLAVEQACQSLQRGDSDVMLAGGLHFTHDLTFWSTFCQLGALSRTEIISPLSANADGILAGEGIGMLVLKRLHDAEVDGDRIYAVINGAASASDGKSSSLLAPAVDGQLLALERAWRQSTLDKHRIGLLEAHGTGTPAGDTAELETLSSFFGSASSGEPRAGLGSVKSMIGHTMPASGAAGLIKAALSVYHGVLPVSLQSENPHPLVEKTRFRLLTQTQAWQQKREDRLAAVNAFGFGGINAHVVLSGHGCEQQDAKIPDILRLSAPSQVALLRKLSHSTSSNFEESGDWRIAIIEPTKKRLSLAKTIIEKAVSWQGRSQIYFSCEPLLNTGKVAFLFPGVDSFFDPQFTDVAQYFNYPMPAFCEKLDPATELLKVGLGLTGLNKGLNQVLNKLNIHADAVAGHSVGEWSAMAASGCLSQTLVDEVNSKMDPDSLAVPDVVFLAVASGIQTLRGLYEDIDDVHLSHDNCPRQVIFCGRNDGISVLSARLKQQKFLTQRLPIVSGFHSPLLAPFAKPFTDFFTSVELSPVKIPLWSANTAQEFPEDTHAKQEIVVKHLVEPIRFREMIDNMHHQGFRAFIQVGFGSLTGFVTDTLKRRPHLTMAANIAKRSGLAQLCHVMAALWVEGGEPAFSVLGDKRVLNKEGTLRRQPEKLHLQLGVPLIKLEHPLNLRGNKPAVKAATLPVVAGENAVLPSTDPLQSLFEKTLMDIQQASEDIQTLWTTRRSQVRRPSTNDSIATFTPVKRVIRRHLDINTNIAWVKDHAFYPQREGWPVLADRHPVVPLTMEISLMRRALQESIPDLIVVGFENLRAYRWLIVEQAVDIDIEIHHSEPGYADVAIKGFVDARAVLAHDYPASPARMDTTYKRPRNTAINASQLYQDNWMFHGPAYQSIVELGPIADNGIRGRLKVSEGEGALLDNMGQLAGYWVMEQDKDCLAMPIGIDKITFFGPDPAIGEQLDCDVFIHSQDAQSCISHQQLIDRNGMVRVQIDGWQTRRYAMDKRFWLHSKQVHKYLLSDTYSEGFVLFDDVYGTTITRDYMAKRYLNQRETQVYERIAPRRKRQWLNGRIAAKDAIRNYLWQQHGHFDFFPKELHIDNDVLGKPLASAHISDTYKEQLSISIAHKDKLAVAVACDREVGIDIEHIETRNDDFIAQFMTAEEIALVQVQVQCDKQRDEVVTRIWAAKEAVAKKSGKGLEGKPKSFVVDQLQGGRLLVNGHWVNSKKYNNYMVCWTE